MIGNIFYPCASQKLESTPFLWARIETDLFCIFFWRARVCWPLLCLWLPFCISERCLDLLDSNAESCRSKQARYQISHRSQLILNHLGNPSLLKFRIQFQFPISIRRNRTFYFELLRKAYVLSGLASNNNLFFYILNKLMKITVLLQPY